MCLTIYLQRVQPRHKELVWTDRTVHNSLTYVTLHHTRQRWNSSALSFVVEHVNHLCEIFGKFQIRFCTNVHKFPIIKIMWYNYYVLFFLIALIISGLIGFDKMRTESFWRRALIEVKITGSSSSRRQKWNLSEIDSSTWEHITRSLLPFPSFCPNLPMGKFFNKTFHSLGIK